MATEKHRRARILDALFDLFEQLKEPSEFPLRLKRHSETLCTLDELGKSGGSPVSYVKFR